MNAAKQICRIKLVPIAPIFGLVFGRREKRALTGLFPTNAFQASGLGLEERGSDCNRRLPCVSCCAVVVMVFTSPIFGFRARKESCPPVVAGVERALPR